MLMKKVLISAITLAAILTITASAQDYEVAATGTLYDVPPRWLVDVPTAGTLPRASYQIGTRFYPGGGAIGFTDIGLSNRLQLGISFGGEEVIGNQHPNWNPRIEFNVKFRPIDERDHFPGVTVGFCSQGFGAWSSDYDRYAFKSRGFFAVVSRSFYFYEWTAGWHGGINYSLENDRDDDKDLNGCLGLDATFKYNLALLIEYDAALNDDKSSLPNGDPYPYAGKGRGYLNLSVKWLFSENLELEALLKDLLVNRRESDTITREIRLTYIDRF